MQDSASASVESITTRKTQRAVHLARLGINLGTLYLGSPIHLLLVVAYCTCYDTRLYEYDATALPTSCTFLHGLEAYFYSQWENKSGKAAQVISTLLSS